MNNYEIYIKTNTGLKLFYEPSDADLGLTDIHFKQAAGGAGSLVFTIYSNHPYYKDVVPLNTDFWLYKAGNPVFRGRCIGAEGDYYKTKTVTVEGDLNFLLDSVQEPFEFSGTTSQFLTRVITAHNSEVEEKKRFTVGTVNVVAQVSLSSEEYKNTMDALKDMVSAAGGYLRIRHGETANYIDYISDYGGENSQTIAFGENLLDLSTSIDPGSIITCLYPLGASVEQSDGTKKRIDVSSVNGGLKYITNDAGISKWGKIWGSVNFDTITSPAALLSEARQYLTKQTALPETFSLTALDLSLVNIDFEAFEIGKWTNVESSEHGVRGQYMLTEMDINISSPEQSVITLNGKQASMVAQTIRQKEDMTKVVNAFAEVISSEMVQRITTATEMITGGLGGYVLIGKAADGHPDEILIMDAPQKENAVNVIRLNKNGIGFSRTGYAGTYRNAWTIDGNLVADFITTGKMSADRIKGGALEIGGTGFAANGSIVVKNASGAVIGTWDINGIDIKAGEVHGSKFIVDARYDDIGPEIAPGGTYGSRGGSVEILPPDDPGYIEPCEEEEGDIEPGEAEEGETNPNVTGAIEVYDARGNLVGKWDANGFETKKGAISGSRINGSTISGSTITGTEFTGGGIVLGGDDASGYILVKDAAGNEIFRLNRSIFRFAGFKCQVSNVSGARYLELEDETVGIGDHETYAVWAGDDPDDPKFIARKDGVVYASELYPGASWWNGWNLTETMEDLWDAVFNS